MIPIPSKIIPFGENKYITLWPFLVYKEPLNPIAINHENIHGRQYVELASAVLILMLIKWIIFGAVFNWLFIVIALTAFYFVDAIDCAFNKTDRGALEREAYENENNPDYLKSRKLFAMWR